MKKSELKQLIKEFIQEEKARYWKGIVPPKDDFGDPITNIFIDGKTQKGPWALMSLQSFKRFGLGKLGVGYGQKYSKQSDGKWLKIEG
jgi:hypothetical protein